MTDTVPPLDTGKDAELARLRRRLEREMAARTEAETIAERGLRELYRRRQQIELLEQIAVAANEATRIDEAMAFAVREICRYTSWPLGHVFMTPDALPALGGSRAGSNPHLVSTPLWHLQTPERFDAFRRITDAIRFASGVGLPGRIWHSGKPAWITDVTVDANFPRAAIALQAGLKAAFGFPVLIGNEVVAVLEFFSEELLPPDDSLLRVMAQIGTQLGRVVERQRARYRLLQDALHDPLTRLANRALFVDRLQNVLMRAERTPTLHYAVLFLDLDRFKAINDTYGHLSGDQLIVAVAGRLTDCLRCSDQVARAAVPGADSADTVLARLGGDEFTILLEDIHGVSDAVRVAERIRRKLAAPFIVAGQEIHCTASIGIALSSSGYRSVQDVLRDADAAVHRAKANGRNGWDVFDPTLRARALHDLQLEGDLHAAVQRREFILRYQPIVSLADGAIVGFEALLRWQHPRRGVVAPADFVPLAESLGLIVPIGEWVLAEACRQAVMFQHAAPRSPPLWISVNVSSRQLSQGTALVDAVTVALDQAGLPPSSLRLELTEAAVAHDPERVSRICDEFEPLGVRLSLDDFGTGLCSLRQLRQLPIESLKIDRSLVSAIDSDGEKRTIAAAIITLAQQFGMHVIAEGAETAAEVAQLKALQCRHAQGFHYYPPLTADAALAALAATG